MKVWKRMRDPLKKELGENRICQNKIYWNLREK